MREVLRDELAFNGNTVRIEYCQFDMGDKYKIKYKKPDEYGFRFETSFATMGEASQYFDKMITGGRSR